MSWTEPDDGVHAEAVTSHGALEFLPDESPTDGEPAGVKKVVTSLPVDHAGNTVYLKGWRLPESTKAPIVIVHDLGEHTDLYRETAYAFVRAGHSTYCFDLRGHGRSGRRLGHAPSYDVLVLDLLQVAAWVRHIEGGRAPLIVGQGIGALIAMDFTKTYGQFCHAAVLSAPCLELSSEMSWFARAAIKLLAEAIPTFRIPAALSPKFAREMKHELKQDQKTTRIATFPLLSAVFTYELLCAIKRAEARFIEYHGQVLIMCPERDNICTYGKVRKAAALHDAHNLAVVDLNDCDHNVFTDSHETRTRAVDAVLSWLDRIGRTPEELAAASDPHHRIKGATRDAVPREKPGATKD